MERALFRSQRKTVSLIIFRFTTFLCLSHLRMSRIARQVRLACLVRTSEATSPDVRRCDGFGWKSRSPLCECRRIAGSQCEDNYSEYCYNTPFSCKPPPVMKMMSPKVPTKHHFISIVEARRRQSSCIVIDAIDLLVSVRGVRGAIAKAVKRKRVVHAYEAGVYR